MDAARDRTGQKYAEIVDLLLDAGAKDYKPGNRLEEKEKRRKRKRKRVEGKEDWLDSDKFQSRWELIEEDIAETYDEEEFANRWKKIT